MPARRELCWTFEQEVTLRRMWANGHSASEIGNVLKVSRNAVLGKRFRLQLPFAEGKAQKTARSYKTRNGNGVPRKPKPVPPKPVPVPKPKPKSRWLMLDELGPNHCRWPEGNGPFVFCGADIDGEGPYCSVHMQEAFKPERIRKSAA